MKNNLLENLAKYLGIRKLDRKLTSKETEFLPSVIEVLETPPSPVGRMVLWTIFGLLIIGIIWSFIGKVDEVAIANGKLIPSGYVKTIQVETQGTVTNIYVKEGQFVHKGELLLELNQVYSQAEYDSLKKEYEYYKLLVARLLAEQKDEELVFDGKKYLGENAMEAQKNLLKSREEEFRAKIASANARIEEANAELIASQANKEKFEALRKIAKDKEERVERLYKEDAVSYFVFLQQQERRIEMDKSIEAQEALIARSNKTIQKAREDLAVLMATQVNDISEKIALTEFKLGEVTEKLKKAERLREAAFIVAPTDGYVSQLAVHTIGAVVSSAQPIMYIVPEDAKLEAEVWIENKDIGFVKEGQEAELKVATFSFQKYGIIDAMVKHISPDAVQRTDKDKNAVDEGMRYKAIVQLSKDYVVVGDNKVYLTPGMGVTAEIKTKQKSIIEFFLDPFRKYQSEALRER